MFNIYDITMTIHEDMQVYKNNPDKRPQITNTRNYSNAKNYESRIALDAHTGTHLDAPLHMLEGGATIDTIPLEQLIGPARVLDLTHVEQGISQADLAPFHIQAGEWLLFKTRNSMSEQFDFEFVYLQADGAQYLRSLNVRGVGTDGLGIERAQPDYGTHKTLFQHDILVLEGLRLKDVAAGNYMLFIAPLKLHGIEAAPARVFLIG